MDFKQLRNFVAVSETGSFSRAATRLNLSQPALSVSIKKLEREIDTELFLRTRKDVELTETGQQLLIYARSALREIDKAQALVAGPKTNRVRTIRLGLNSILAHAVAKHVIAEFGAQHSNIRIEVEVTTAPQAEAIERVSSGRWDFGVVLGNLPANCPKDLVAETCMRLTSVPHARKAHPLANKRTLSLGDLADYKWIMSTMLAEPAFPGEFVKAGFKRPTVVTRVNSFDFIMTVIEKSDALTILPSEIVARFYPNRFTRLPHKNLEYRTDVSLLRSRDLEIPPPSLLLMEQIGAFLRSIN